MILFNTTLYLSFLFKCLLACILGGSIGLEREYKNKPAGIKTHMLICVGATALTYLSFKFAGMGDPIRIVAQIVSGIGFIGAGTILHSKKFVQGLTTAATLWVAATIGMFVGSGYLVYAISLTVLVVLLLLIINSIPAMKHEQNHYSLSIEVLHLSALDKIEDMVKKFNLCIEHKILTKNDNLCLDINYSTTSVTQHLFLKKLFQLKDLGQIIKI
jgi:putative Mg2+ transporter-C (MgtC) family protein